MIIVHIGPTGFPSHFYTSHSIIMKQVLNNVLCAITFAIKSF